MSESPSKDEYIELLKTFIGFKSTDSEPIQKKLCLDWVEESFLSTQKKNIQRGDFEDSAWLYLPVSDCKLLVFAHCDTVPAPEEMFDLSLDGDRAMGRGTSDMKGNVLPFLMAYRDALKEGIQPPVSILLTTDEEVAGRTIPHLLKEGTVKAPVAYTPDSSDKGIVVEHKGVVWSELVCSGKGGHGAYPWNTNNPAWTLAEALVKIKEAFPPGQETDWQMTVSPTMLSGSNARNQIDDEVTCGLDIRFPPQVCATADEALDRVRAVLPEGCVLEEVLRASPLNTDSQHPMVQAFKDIAEQILDRDIPFRREHGGTDARYFGEAGIPAFLFGPEGGGLHSKEEWVSVSSLKKHVMMYQTLFKELGF